MKKLCIIALTVAAASNQAHALDVNGSGGERLGAPNVYTYNRNSGVYSDFNGNYGQFNERTGQSMIWRKNGSIGSGQFDPDTGFGYFD